MVTDGYLRPGADVLLGKSITDGLLVVIAPETAGPADPTIQSGTNASTATHTGTAAVVEAATTSSAAAHADLAALVEAAINASAASHTDAPSIFEQADNSSVAFHDDIATVGAPAITYAVSMGFLRRTDTGALASTSSLAGATMQSGFLRGPSGLAALGPLVVVASGGPAAESMGFLRDPAGALVTTTDATGASTQDGFLRSPPPAGGTHGALVISTGTAASYVNGLPLDAQGRLVLQPT